MTTLIKWNLSGYWNAIYTAPITRPKRNNVPNENLARPISTDSPSLFTWKYVLHKLLKLIIDPSNSPQKIDLCGVAKARITKMVIIIAAYTV